LSVNVVVEVAGELFMMSKPNGSTNSKWRGAAKLSLFLAFIMVLDGCKPRQSAGEPESYIENGKVWAYGSVQLTALGDTPKILIKRNTVVQGLDAHGNQTETPRFSLLGTIDEAEMKEMAYVDYHPELNRALAYHYGVEFFRRGTDSNGSEIIDVFGILRKSGRSYYKRQKVYLGQARIGSNADTGKVTLADGMKISSIATGVFSGQWAFHYPDIRRIEIRPWSSMCSKSVTQRPGQTPGQNPGQFDTCRPMPKEHDLCNSDPTKQGCRPAPMVQSPGLPQGQNQFPNQEPAKVVDGLDEISSDEQVFSLHDDIKTAKVVFVSRQRKAASEEENATVCANDFMAVGRTLNRQINESCVIKPAPSDSRDGQLTCAITVSFEQASTYLENVCNITAVFRGVDSETQVIQVLRKK